jgi:hypothetical protein
MFRTIYRKTNERKAMVFYLKKRNRVSPTWVAGGILILIVALCSDTTAYDM